MTIILFGVFWGFIEATLGGFLHAVRFPMTGSIMAPIGFAILFMAVRRCANSGQLIAITVVAAAFKFFDVYLFNLSPFQTVILNPAQAILMQGLSFAAFAWLIRSQSPAKMALAAAAMTTMSVILFNLIGYFIIGQTKVQLINNPLSVLVFHLPLAVILTYVLIELVSRIDQIKIEAFTMKHSPIALRAATCMIMIVVGLAAQKWLN